MTVTFADKISLAIVSVLVLFFLLANAKYAKKNYDGCPPGAFCDPAQQMNN